MATITPIPTFRESIVASVGKAMGAEMIGAFLGSRLEGATLSILSGSPLSLIGAGSLAFLASRVSETTHPLLKKALFALPVLWAASHLLNPSTAAGELLGTIMGGYLGLKWLNPQLDLFGEEQSSGYFISTLRFELVGLFFRSLRLTSSLPYVTAPLSVAMVVTKLALQNLAFHSNRIIPLLKGVFQPAHREKWTVCKALGGLTSRYVNEELRGQLNTLLDFNVPLLGRTLSSVAVGLQLDEACSSVLASENWPEFLTLSFPVYVAALQSRTGWGEASAAHREAFFEDFSDEQDFLDRVEKIVIPTKPFWLSSVDLEPHVQRLTASLSSSMEGMQEKLVGRSFVTQRQKEYLKRVLPLYVKGYIVFALKEFKQTHLGSTLQDEEVFFQTLTTLLTEAYFQTKMSETVVGKVAGCAVSTFYTILRHAHQWITTSEQSSSLGHRITIQDDYS